MKMQPGSVTQPGFMLLHGIGMLPSVPFCCIIMPDIWHRRGIAGRRNREDRGTHIGGHEQRGEDLAKQAHRHPHLIRRRLTGIKPIQGGIKGRSECSPNLV